MKRKAAETSASSNLSVCSVDKVKKKKLLSKNADSDFSKKGKALSPSKSLEKLKNTCSESSFDINDSGNLEKKSQKKIHFKKKVQAKKMPISPGDPDRSTKKMKGILKGSGGGMDGPDSDSVAFQERIREKRGDMESQNAESKELKKKSFSKDKLRGVKKVPFKKSVDWKGGKFKGGLVKGKFKPVGKNTASEGGAKPGEVDKKEQRKKQKLLREERRQKERGYALTGEAKAMFEELRCHQTSPARRTQLARQLYDLLSSKLNSAVRSHDLTRIVEWLIKVGPADLKVKLVSQLLPQTIELAKCKYSNHIILRILKDTDKSTRQSICSYFVGNVKSLIKSRFSSVVIDEYYTKYAKSSEKGFLRQELYSDLLKGAKNPAVTTLSQALTVLAKDNPSMRKSILNNTKTALSKLIDKKFCLDKNLVCDVFLEYLEHSEEEERVDLLETLKANVSVLLKCSSGARVLMHLLWESGVKVKKAIVKELKSQVVSVAKSEGYLFLMSLFDSVDDTVLIKKAILPALLQNAEELVANSNGKKVLLYLIAHRDPVFFHPKEIQELKKADNSTNVKKDIEIKEKELLEPCLEGLLNKIKENPKFWFSEPGIALVTQAVLKKSSGKNLSEVYQAVSEYLVESMSGETPKIIEDAGIQITLKKLIKEDAVTEEDSRFAYFFVEALTSEVVENLISSNRGCFLLVHLLETNLASVKSKLKHFYKEGKLQKKLENKDFKGAEILKNHFTTM